MPYSISNPPERIEALPKHAQEIWIAAFNAAIEQYDNDEARANSTAWAAVKLDYQQDEEGNWHAKAVDMTPAPEWSEPDDTATKAGRRLQGAMLNKAKEALVAFADLVKWAAYEDAEPEPEEDDEPMEEKAIGLVTVGPAIKALGDGKIGGPAIKFGDASKTDLVGDFFTKDTYYGPAQSSLVWVHHRQPLAGKRHRVQRTRPLTNPAVLTMRETDIWAEVILDMRDEYEAMLYGAAEKGLLGFSTGTAPHLVERVPQSNGSAWVKQWILGTDLSLTPIPCEPDIQVQVMPLKAYLDKAEAYVKAIMSEADATEAPAADATTAMPVPEVKAAQPSDDYTEKETMNEEQLQAVIAQAAKDAAAAAVKAYEDRLAAEPPINPAGVAITKPAEVKDNRPAFKSLGEFLLTVARAGQHGITDQRLMELKSNDPLDENGFNVAKAVGPEVLGNLKSAIKAPSGLGEQLGSGGGFLVGQDRGAGILSRMYDVGQVLRLVKMLPVSAGSNGVTLYAEDETSRAAGYRRGGIQAYWTAEAAALTASSPKFREMNLKLNKLTGLVYATDELLADATALEAWITEKLPDELRYKAEDAIINGTGAGMPLGVVNSGALITVTKETGQAADTVVAENIWEMYSRMWAPSIPRAVWLISQDVWPQLFALSLSVGAGGVALFQPPNGIAGAPFGTLLGRPVIPCEYCDKLGDANDVLFVDLNQYTMISKGGMQADSSMHVRFVYGENTFRFIWRLDGQPDWNADLDPANGGDAVSPFVALGERA